jgi:hypothetical protein
MNTCEGCKWLEPARDGNESYCSVKELQSPDPCPAFDLGWIPVKDRLPDKDGWYLIFSTDGQRDAVAIDYFLSVLSPWRDIQKKPITHWANLPAPPVMPTGKEGQDGH